MLMIVNQLAETPRDQSDLVAYEDGFFHFERGVAKLALAGLAIGACIYGEGVQRLQLPEQDENGGLKLSFEEAQLAMSGLAEIDSRMIPRLDDEFAKISRRRVQGLGMILGPLIIRHGIELDDDDALSYLVLIDELSLDQLDLDSSDCRPVLG